MSFHYVIYITIIRLSTYIIVYIQNNFVCAGVATKTFFLETETICRLTNKAFQNLKINTNGTNLDIPAYS